MGAARLVQRLVSYLIDLLISFLCLVIFLDIILNAVIWIKEIADGRIVVQSVNNISNVLTHVTADVVFAGQ